MDIKNHKLVWDNTDHQSVSKHMGSIALISQGQTLQHQVSWSHTIFPSTQVLTIVFKRPCLQKHQHFKKKDSELQATRQLTPVYCVEHHSSLLMVWGQVPSLLFIEPSACEASKFCLKGGVETLACWRREAFLLCCMCNLQSSWCTKKTCYCWLLQCNHIKVHSHFISFLTFYFASSPLIWMRWPTSSHHIFLQRNSFSSLASLHHHSWF